MKRALSILAAVAIAVVLGGAAGKVPAEVIAHITGMDQECRDGGGQASHPGSLVEHGVIGKDATEVWVIDEGKYQCDGAASLFSGSGGAQVVVFAKQNDGSVRQVFERGAYGVSFMPTGSSSELLLRVGGGLCGQAGDPTHAETIACDRPLIWRRAIQKMEFAPLSQVRPITANGGQR
jgi:hypothetical protein